MQKKKSTKDTRNAEYRKLKAEFERYIQYNTVQRKHLRDAEYIAGKNKELAEYSQMKLILAEREIQRLKNALRVISIVDTMPMTKDDLEQTLVDVAKLADEILKDGAINEI